MTSNQTEVDTAGVVKEFVARELLEGNDQGLDEQTPLLEAGIIDSMSVLKLVRFVDEHFGIQLPPQELSSGNLETISAIARLIDAHR